MAVADNLNQALANYSRILVMVTQIVAAGQTQSQVDAIVKAATNAGIPLPKPTVSTEGETWNWTEYQTFIIQQMLPLEQAAQRASGPFQIRSRGAI